MVRPHIRVEWDPTFFGGDYSGVGRFVYIPVDDVEEAGSVEAAFKATGKNPANIIHYTEDELFDQWGELFLGGLCEHKPVWASVTCADSCDGIVDITCSECGASGSVAINPEDIQW